MKSLRRSGILRFELEGLDVHLRTWDGTYQSERIPGCGTRFQ